MIRPNPGSPEAVSLGCICPVLDNHSGQGWKDSAGKNVWRVNWACPVHGTSKARERKEPHNA